MSAQAIRIDKIQDKQMSFGEVVGRLARVKTQPIESFQSKIINGDVIQELKKLNKNHKFDVIIVDPPYNIGKDFGNNNDTMEMGECIKWSKKWLDLCFDVLANNGLIYVYGFPEILARLAVEYPIEKQRILAWHYTNKTVNEGGALPRDVIKIPALAGGAGKIERHFMCKTCQNTLYKSSELKKHQEHDILQHPTQKPMELTKKLIQSRINGNNGRTLIPFVGSGSECVTAKNLGVEYLGIELNPEYVEYANKWLKIIDSVDI